MEQSKTLELATHYIPSIKEFCLGFEFEYFVRNLDDEEKEAEWVKSKVVLDNSNDARKKGLTFPILKDIPLKYYQIGLALKNKTIRTKYLDKQDFNDMGWDTDLQGFYVQDIYPNRWYIEHEPENHWVTIHDEQNESGFSGTIHNKTQLRNILTHVI